MPRASLLLIAVLLLWGCNEDPVAQADEAAAQGDHTLAADLYRQAALQAPCPQRARLMLRRSEVLELAGHGSMALEAVDKAVGTCPEDAEARWVRAQRFAAAGERARALEDARTVASRIPAAAELYASISAELDAERAVRDRARSLVQSLQEQLKPEAKDAPCDPPENPILARQIPLPMTLEYAVQQKVRSPKAFELAWNETLSYRGDAAEGAYLLVRSLDVPPLPRDLPMYFRLAMSNLRLPMRFKVDSRGAVVDAGWLRDGPNRGMRPEMLSPEIEGMLKRRRLFDPGRDGVRNPGDSWRGEDVRVVDGQPVEVSYDSEARGWERVAGVATLHVASRVRGTGYEADEDAWIHPETAVPVRWSRTATYRIQAEDGADPWREHLEGVLVQVAGGE